MGLLSNKSKEEFRHMLKSWTDKNDPDAVLYPAWMRAEFFTYWTSMNEGGRKMYFQMEKKWNTGLRLSTWKRNSQNDKRWRQSEQKAVYKAPTKTEADYIPPPIDYKAAQERLRNEPTHRGSIGELIRRHVNR